MFKQNSCTTTGKEIINSYIRLPASSPQNLLSLQRFHGSKTRFRRRDRIQHCSIFSTSSGRRRCQSTTASSPSSSRCRKMNLRYVQTGRGICPLPQPWELLESSSTMIGPTASPIWKAASCISGTGSARLSSILPASGTRTCNEKRHDYECHHLFS